MPIWTDIKVLKYEIKYTQTAEVKQFVMLFIVYTADDNKKIYDQAQI